MLDASGHFSVSLSKFDDAILAQRAKSFGACIIDLDFSDCGGIAMLGALRRESSASPAARAVGWTTLGHLWRGDPVTPCSTRSWRSKRQCERFWRRCEGLLVRRVMNPLTRLRQRRLANNAFNQVGALNDIAVAL
jgi:hypothetical protein